MPSQPFLVFVRLETPIHPASRPTRCMMRKRTCHARGVGRRKSSPATTAVDPVVVVARNPAAAVDRREHSSPCTDCSPGDSVRGSEPLQNERELPIMVKTREGKQAIKSFRSRWAQTRQGSIKDIEVLCRNCAAPLKARDVPYRIVGMFSCKLDCPRCSRVSLAYGSKRTLLMTLKILIAEHDDAEDGFRLFL